MKLILIFISVLLVSCAHTSRHLASTAEVRHIVFDIDWTLVAEIKEVNQDTLKNKRVIKVFEKYYFVNEGVEEFIEEILKHPDMKISFYSGGERTRNLELLSKIKLKDQRTLKDISYKILSREDLVSIEGISLDAPFHERFKKDLTKISKDLNELIMFDDTAHFVLNSVDAQEENVFFLGTAFEHFENYNDAARKTGKYVPKNIDEWLLDRKKLIILKEAFKEAYNEASSDININFKEAMKRKERLLDLKSHEWNSYSNRLYNIHFKSHNPSVPSSCQELTQALF